MRRRPLHVRPASAALPTLLLSLGLGLGLSLPAAASTYVGNPKIAVRIATASGLGFTSAKTDDPTLNLDTCGTTGMGTGLVDVTSGQTVVEPEFCGITLGTDGLLTIAGTGPSSSTFTLDLDLSSITVDFVAAEGMGPLDDGAAYYLELADADWTSATALGLQASTHTTIDSTDPVHDDLVNSLQLDSRVFIDTNGDGVLSTAERQAGAL